MNAFAVANTMLDNLQAQLRAQQDLITTLTQQIADLSARLTVLEAPPVPEPEPAPTGIWISTPEIKVLPTAGEEWDQLLSYARRDWGTADLSNNDSQHDICTLAGALVAVRLFDPPLQGKVVGALVSATKSPLSRVLEAARGLLAYVIAADLIGYHDPTFEAWVGRMVNSPLPNGGRHGDQSLLDAVQHDSSNWGNHARASVLAAALYLDNTDWRDKVIAAHKEYIGLDVATPELVYNTPLTNWHADPVHPCGINRKGTARGDIVLDGVVPEEYRRGGEAQEPPVFDVHIPEAFQGLVVVATLLHRHKLVDFTAGDHAVVRAVDRLYAWTTLTGDDCWIVPLVNRYGGTAYPVQLGTPGKGLAWAQWTHGAGG